MSDLENIAIFTDKGDEEFGGNICRILGVELSKNEAKQFSDSDPKLTLHGELAGKDVFYVTRFHERTPLQFINTLLAIEAATEESARSIHVVDCYCGMSRQERKTRPGEAVSMRVKAICFSALELDSYTTFSIHSPTSIGFFHPSVTALTLPLWTLPLRYIHANTPAGKKLKIGSADTNTKPAMEMLSCSTVKGDSRYDTEVAIINKDRVYARSGEIDRNALIGEVNGYAVVLIDDEIGTASTIINAAKLCKANGAAEIIAGATHCKASPDGKGIVLLETAMDEGFIDRCILTNTCGIHPNLYEALNNPKYQDKFVIIPIEPVIAELIRLKSNAYSGKGSTKINHLFSSARIKTVYDRLHAALTEREGSGLNSAQLTREIEFCNAMTWPVSGVFRAINDGRTQPTPDELHIYQKLIK